MKRSLSEQVFNAFNITFMLALIFVTGYPLLYVAFSSISHPTQLMQHQGLLLAPYGFHLDAYRMVFKNPMILYGYRNTLFYVITGTCVNLMMTSLAAYVLSRKGLYWRSPMTVFIVFTMFFSGGIVPTYLIVKSLGLTDTVWALIFPNAMSAYNMIIMRTAFQAMPDSLEESARMEGAGDFRVLFQIIIPLCMPTVAVMILNYGVGHWNSWFSAMVYLRTRELYPLQLILREILISNDMNIMTAGSAVNVGDQIPIGETIKYATIMVSILPILCIYPFLQKYFAKGMMIGAVKG